MKICRILILLTCLSAGSARTLGDQNRPDPTATYAVRGQPDRSSDSSLQRNQNRGSTLDERDRNPSTESSFSASGEGQRQGIAKSNKASCLLGMEVRNQHNEKLGDIKDLVMDLRSGRIHYVVLSSGGFLGMGERLVAIPPSAMQVSADAEQMVINADKQKVMNAPSFARTNWPDPHSANFEAYWASDREAVGGASAGVSVGAATGQSDRNDYRAGTERHRRIESRYSTDRSSADKADKHVFKGRITAINPEARTMTIEGEDGSRTFTFTDRPALTLKSNRNPHLIDFKTGYSVAVGYHEEGNGKYVAHSITRTEAPEIK